MSHDEIVLGRPAARGGLKSALRCGLALAGLLTTAVCWRAEAQFSLDWWTVDGGGGQSTGGVFTVSGTVGQPDAGRMSGGSFTVQGGFWSVLAAVQTPGAPLLSIERTATNSVIVSWPAPADGWQLQENTEVSSTNWVEVVVTPLVVDGRKQVVLGPPVGNRFYRLSRP